MKTKTLQQTIGIAVSILFLNSLTASAVTSASLKKTLGDTPAAEMPATVARLVSQSSTGDKKATTLAAVEAAVGLNPAAAPAIVGAIAQASPEMAVIAAARAAALQPKQAGAIARAAAAAAPKQVEEIVFAICKELPTQFSVIAIGAAQGAPDYSREILTGLSSALPGLKSFIDEARADSTASTVEAVVQVADQSFVRYSKTHPGASYSGPIIQLTPRTGPPFTGGSGTNEIRRGQTSEVPPGSGRNYSQ